MMARIMPFFPLSRPPLDWIQLEVTTHCNAACIYCPQTAYGSVWKGAHFPTQDFERLLPSFRPLTRHLHLQGWGEPMLHPDFFSWIRSAKKAGLWVSTTSNGSLIDRDIGKRLIESGLDLIALSLAGTRETTNDRIRQGTRLSRVMEALEILQRLKVDNHGEKPSVHVAYLVFRSVLEEVSELVSLLTGLGVEQVIISTLDFIPAKELQNEVIQPRSQEEAKAIKGFFDSVVTEGGKRGMKISYSFPDLDPQGFLCSENPFRALCVAVDGWVSACVYNNLPIEGETYYTAQGERRYKRKGFGTVPNRSLGEIWRSGPFRRFREQFRQGVLDSVCRSCLKLK